MHEKGIMPAVDIGMEMPEVDIPTSESEKVARFPRPGQSLGRWMRKISRGGRGRLDQKSEGR